MLLMCLPGWRCLDVKAITTVSQFAAISVCVVFHPNGHFCESASEVETIYLLMCIAVQVVVAQQHSLSLSHSRRTWKTFLILLHFKLPAICVCVYVTQLAVSLEFRQTRDVYTLYNP